MNLNQITVPSIDVSNSIKFYTLLGLKLIVHSTDNYARFLCPNGESTFSVQKVKTINPENGIKIYFEVNDLDTTIENLIKKGIKIDEMPEDKSWLWREALLKDPDGNKIILYFAGNNRINPPWRIKI